MTPQLYDGTVLISTCRATPVFYKGNGDGIVWALDAATGKTKWKFNTISDGAKLFGNPKVNSGGGLWYPPSVDSQGRVFISVANPAPLYGTPKFPNGSSRPGPNLYTELDRRARRADREAALVPQAVPHDVRDYDLMIPAILTTVPIRASRPRSCSSPGRWARPTPTAPTTARRSGRAPSARTRTTPARCRAGARTASSRATSAASRRRWRSRTTVSSCPGSTLAATRERDRHRGRLRKTSAAAGAASPPSTPPPARCSGSTSCRRWTSARPRSRTTSSSPATYAGTIYAFDTQTGKTLWTTKAPAGINSFPAIDGDTLLVGAGAPGCIKKPQFQLVAYSLQ